MNFKNNKGYVGIDASIAVIVLLIIVPTIVGMIYNVNKTNNLIDRKSEAINIAVNTIESAKGIDVLTNLTENNVKNALKEMYKEDLDEEEFILTKNENTYKIEVRIQDYKEINAEAIENVVKIVKVIVRYRSGQEDKNIELNTVIS